MQIMKRSWTSISLVCVLTCVSAAGAASEWHVPADFPTIQAAISAAAAGDAIIVAPGTYHEAINFEGKAITLRSSDGPAATVIDASTIPGGASVVTFNSGEGADTIIDGFTITGGEGTDAFGSRIGGGILLDLFSSPTIINCIIRNNTADLGAGLIANDFSSPLLINCIIAENIALSQGGATSHFIDSNPTYINCTFANNEAPFGSAIDIATFCHPTIVNSIIWGNTHAFPDGHISGFPTIRDSIVQDGYAGGTNIIDVDPLFIDPTPGAADYRLAVGSPAIDAGDNAEIPIALPASHFDPDGNPRIVDGTGDGVSTVDLGAYEFQCKPGDLNCDGVVNVFDLLALLGNWGPCPNCPPVTCPGDVDNNCIVNVFDLLALLANWG